MIREHPTLISPAIVAGLFGLGMQRLSKVALKFIEHSFTTGHSVLGGEVPNGAISSYPPPVVGIPVGLGRQFLTVVVFVAALVVTAGRVRTYVESALPGVQPSAISASSRWRTTLLFSLAFMALMGTLTVLGSTALTYPAALAYLWPQTFHFSVLVSSVITTSLVAWFLAPWSVRLLQQPGLVLTSSVEMSARIFAMIAFALQPVLGDLLFKFEAHPGAGQEWEHTGLSIINTAVTNLPLALLFVALGLLAMEPARAATIGAEGQPALHSVESDMSTDSDSIPEA